MHKHSRLKKTCALAVLALSIGAMLTGCEGKTVTQQEVEYGKKLIDKANEVVNTAQGLGDEANDLINKIP